MTSSGNGDIVLEALLSKGSGVSAVLATISFPCLSKTSHCYSCTPDLLNRVMQSLPYLRMIPSFPM